MTLVNNISGLRVTNWIVCVTMFKHLALFIGYMLSLCVQILAILRIKHLASTNFSHFRNFLLLIEKFLLLIENRYGVDY